MPPDGKTMDIGTIQTDIAAARPVIGMAAIIKIVLKYIMPARMDII
jgi:hypothetical protein